MPATPVARLALDTRAHGPYFCEECDAENEDALLMSDATVVCPECKAVMPAFEQFSEAIVSAAPVVPASGRKSLRKKRWAIHWESPDTSNEGTTAYDNMQEALDAATSWIKYQAADELENDKLRKQADSDDDPWESEDQERMDLLESILKDIKEGNLSGAVASWLEYQGDVDHEDRIEIGPSGDVTDSSGDFLRSVKNEG